MDKTKIIIFSIIGLIVVLVIVVILINPFKAPQPAPVTLEFWSVFDDSSAYTQLITQFQQQYPYITIKYYKKNIVTYEEELVDALAAGRGPDIFSIHNTWLPKHMDKLVAVPAALITPQRFGEVFVDVTAQDFMADNKVYAFPLAVDTLALFYNKDLLNSAGIAQPPKTWAEFNSAAEKLTQRDTKNNIIQAGAALGTAKNINRATDILAVLMLQQGAKMVNDDKSSASFDQSISTAAGGSFNPGLQALKFYTNFANPGLKVYTWNQAQNYSIDAFVEGRAAMMINYAYQISAIKAKAPHLSFAVAALPQISTTGRQVSFANYWAQAVSKSSTDTNQAAAWQFLSWLAAKENNQKYLDATDKVAARKDIAQEQINSVDEKSIFAKQALTAKSWWEVDNLAVERIFADMIEAVVLGSQTADNALRSAGQQVTLLMGEKNK